MKVMIGRISLIELIRISGGFNSNVGIVCSTNIEISFHGSSFLREAKSLTPGAQSCASWGKVINVTTTGDKLPKILFAEFCFILPGVPILSSPGCNDFNIIF